MGESLKEKTNHNNYLTLHTYVLIKSRKIKVVRFDISYLVHELGCYILKFIVK